MIRRIEGVVADHGVVIGIHVDPIHRVAGANGDGERLEAILLGHDDHPVMPAFLCRPAPCDESDYGEEHQHDRNRGERPNRHGDLLVPL